MKTLRFALVLILPAMLFNACAQDSSLQIVAIHSVKAPLREIVRIYKQKNPNVTIRMSFKPTGAIYNEVNGDSTNSDVVILLNSQWLDNLTSTNKVRNVERFGTNTLLLVGSIYSPSSVKAPTDIVPMLANNRLALNDPATNVSGRLSVDILNYYGIYNDIRDRIRIIPTTARTLQAVEVNQISYAIIYRTDALSSDSVKMIYTFPQESYAPIIYSIGEVSYNESGDVYKQFIKFLHAKEAQGILELYGFL